MGKTIINILGAYDRHNYGDLLFALILKDILETKLNNQLYITDFYGIIESDLSTYGALKTKKLSDLYESMENESTILIIAGGDILTAQWSSVLLALKHPANLVMRGGRVTSKVFNRNKLAKFILDGKSDFPFVIRKSEFPRLKALLYNSVGGTNFNKFSHLYDRSLFGDYLSVRDKNLFNLIKEKTEDVQLVPDSAIIMSEIYPINHLSQVVSPIVKAFAEKETFVFFQINKSIAKDQLDVITETLKGISKAHNLKICLCPIGRASSHEDHIPLKIIHNQLKEDSFYIDQPSVWDTMYLIAKSKTYIGTSLHGAITAMSYNVPYMGVKVVKLDAYLKSWSFEPLNRTYGITEVQSNFENIINVDTEKLVASRNKQVSLVNKSFDKMVSIIQS